MLSTVTPGHPRIGARFLPTPSLMWIALLAALIASSVVLLGKPPTTAAGTQYSLHRPGSGPASPAECTWSFVPSPNTHQYNSLNGVAALSPNDVWAVGSRGDSFTGELTLIEHWNGSSWAIVPSPNPGGESNELMGVSALSENDIWAVGYHSTALHTLILHWDGSAWIHVPSPDVGTITNALRSVVAIAPDDVWAVGYSWGDGGNRRRTLILHWDGAEWSIVPSPSAGPQDNYLLSVSATARDDVWAVGSYVSAGGSSQTLMLHWDGAEWSIAPSPNVLSVNNFLNGVSVLSPNDAWAVGYACEGNCFSTPHMPLAMRWNGTQWNFVPTPEISQYMILNAVEALSANDVWTVGLISTGTTAEPLTLHWDGAQLSQRPAVNPGSTSPELKAISAIASNDIWATGAFHYTGNPVFRTLTEHYTGTCPPASVTPVSPTVTQAPPTSTNTPPATASPTVATTSEPTNTGVAATWTPTNSPAITATPPCEITFSDVPPGSTFYTHVQCLACRGIISGYADGTFKLGNDVTRGQLSKIVSNAAGFNEPVSGQTFQDVTPTHTFYEFIERMAARGIIGGYSDGTFRPSSPATRGQIAKIVSNAAGFNEPVSGQTFQDVTPTHTFYEFIERMAVRGIIGGYSDGTFRPGNNATRGQTAKIVANTFFPQCGQANITSR